VVISGDHVAAVAIAERLRAEGHRVHRLSVSHAFHSPLMEPMIDEFGTVAAGLAIDKPVIPIISNLTGQPAADDFGSPEYWKCHVRDAVRFADSVRFAQSAGATRFLEVGPSSGLTAAIEETLADAPVVTVSALRKDRPEPVALVNAVAQGWVCGMDVDWRGALGTGHLVDLPTYALTGGAFGFPATARPPMRRGWAWPPATTPCWARWWNCPPRVACCSPAGCHRPARAGWPTTPSVAWCCSPARGSSNWRSAPATRWAAASSTS
jgi:acyl transferase domain-containing protein